MDQGASILALELGGTKTVAAVGTADGCVTDEVRFPTMDPVGTLRVAVDWWRGRVDCEGRVRIGVAAFGPVRVRCDAADYGEMQSTPKPGWSGFPIVGFLNDSFPRAKILLDTDVNAAALAESEMGAAKRHSDMAYITVGTGIGAGIRSAGRLVHGALHPEFGHLRVPRHPEDSYAGSCVFHGDCLEGLAAGPAIRQRWGVEGLDLPCGHPAWEMEAWYLAHGILALCSITSPEVVVLGGGVPQADGLHALVAKQLKSLSNGYFPQAEKDDFVVMPGLGQQAGIAGALLLAGG